MIPFCDEATFNRCIGNKIIRKIKTKEKEYVVVGGDAGIASFAGLGYAINDISGSYAYIGLFAVSSKEIAEHLSTYFGKLIFEIMYERGDWEWVE